RELGKNAGLEIRGREIEIDRRILEEIKEPLIHLLRNAADHGIEAPEERMAKGKPPEGRIAITLSQKDGGKVEIAVSDDGAGIDPEKVRASGRKLGLLADEENGSIAPLLFSSGFSTSPAVTGLSGRGLGLAIVLEKVEKLGGRIDVDASLDSGTVFRILLPLTLATFRGVLVTAGGRHFVIPSSAIGRILRVERKAVTSVENLETVEMEKEALPVSNLAELLELEVTDPPGSHVPLIVLSRAGEKTGLSVEAVLGEQEVLVKSLGPQLIRVRNVSGACLLGTGEIVPVLNASDLMKSARKNPGVRPARRERRKRILVAEDSITSRTLLKGILESAGYEVSTAVDGIDAQLQLKNGSFDLLVSDVDMPGMNGFDLTAEIRSDTNLSSLPVVLVTSLDSREHREKGAEVGASAYIVKSSFEQSDFVEAVGRLA
ncbi:MAG TPA: response regulator, partial [Burkholderiales bacterium]|nr:response regulator [Burkholderiales bacterium]